MVCATGPDINLQTLRLTRQIRTCRGKQVWLGASGTEAVIAKRIPLIGDANLALFLRGERAGVNAHQLAWERHNTAGTHQPIPRLYDYGEQDGYFTLILERVPGRDLDAIVKHGRVDRDQALDITVQLVRALTIWQQDGACIVHADLTPANLRIGPTGQVYVFDFGTATILDSTVHNVANILCTPLYCPPERLCAGGVVDRQSDPWSVMVTFYQMLSGGRLPYPLKKGNPDFSRCKPDPIADVSDSCNAVLQKALCVEPGRRYDSVEALTEDLDRLRTGRMTEAEYELQQPVTEPARQNLPPDVFVRASAVLSWFSSSCARRLTRQVVYALALLVAIVIALHAVVFAANYRLAESIHENKITLDAARGRLRQLERWPVLPRALERARTELKLRSARERPRPRQTRGRNVKNGLKRNHK